MAMLDLWQPAAILWRLSCKNTNSIMIATSLRLPIRVGKE